MNKTHASVTDHRLSKRILFLSPFFHPELISTGRYNTHLVKALVAQGFAVEVVASHPLYPDWVPHFSDAALPGVRIHCGGLWMRYPRSNVLRRLMLELWYAGFALRHAWRLRKQVGLVIAILPPDLFLLPVSRLLPRGVPRVGIIHDLQGIMAISAASPLRRLVARMIRGVEKRVFSCCDTLICLSASMQQQLVQDYSIPASRCRIHYPFVTSDAEAGSGSLPEGMFPAGFLHVVYAGALGEKQMPWALLGFFRDLCALRADVMCHIFSSGPFFEDLRGSDAGADERMRFHGLVADDALQALYACSTVQVIPQAGGTGAGAFPSKLPNLLAAGVPVFAICDPHRELATVIDETGAGRHTDQDDAAQWVAQLSAFLDEVKGRSHTEFRQLSAACMDDQFSVARLVEALSRLSV